MKNWLTRIFRLFRKHERSQHKQLAARFSLPEAPMAPAWRAECQTAWRQFLSTDAGVTLMARLRAVECHVAVAACTNPLSTAHACGAANGWRECRQWLESLSRSSARNSDGPSDGADQVGTEAEGNNGRGNTSNRHEGEAELLARLSP